VSTAVLWEHVDGGEDVAEVAAAFDLTVSQVNWALAHELPRRAA
jgi:uncharacterized protein (DUF433 family)